MNLYKMFKTSEYNEKEGIFIELAPGVKFKITRIGGSNKKYQEMFANLTRPYKRLIDSGNLQNDMARKLLITAFTEAALVGWEGVTDAAGNPLEYTKENATKLFTDLPDLFDTLNTEASNAQNFKDEEVESIAKKSPTTSSGVEHGTVN